MALGKDSQVQSKVKRFRPFIKNMIDKEQRIFSVALYWN